MARLAQIVIFGASGDLTARKLVPALLRNFEEDNFRGPIQVIGVSRTEKTDAAWREELSSWIPESQKAVWERFKPLLSYKSADSADPRQIEALEGHLDSLALNAGEEPHHVGRLFYLALAPHLFISTVQALSERGLVACDADEAVAIANASEAIAARDPLATIAPRQSTIANPSASRCSVPPVRRPRADFSLA